MAPTATTLARRADALLAPVTRAVHHLAARESSCEDGDTSARCEKPFDSKKITGITIGITFGVILIITCSVLGYLHIRRERVERKEDAINFELDGDVDDHPTMGKPPASWQRQGQPKAENPFESQQQSQQQENPFEQGRR